MPRQSQCFGGLYVCHHSSKCASALENTHQHTFSHLHLMVFLNCDQHQKAAHKEAWIQYFDRILYTSEFVFKVASVA